MIEALRKIRLKNGWIKPQMKRIKDFVQEYIEEIWRRITEIVPLVSFYSIQWVDERENEVGTNFSVTYNPQAFTLTLLCMYIKAFLIMFQRMG